MYSAVVTGGAGFIGSNLVDKLISQGFSKIKVIDDLSTGKIDNLSQHKSEPRLEFYEKSILDFDSLCQVIQPQDLIFHLAAIPSVPRSIENPVKTFAANVEGTQNVLEAARLKKAKRVVFSSSSSLYGGVQHQQPRKEDLNTSVLSPYAAHKNCGENLCSGYSSSFKLETAILRYFNIFGPRQNPDSQYSAVIPKFIRQGLADEEIIIQGSGMQSRDFTYVDNAVNANILAATHRDPIFAQVFNVGCGDNFNLLVLLEKISILLGKKLKVRHVEGRLGDPFFSLADVSKIEKMIGYKVEVDFDQGLEKLVNSMRSQYK